MWSIALIGLCNVVGAYLSGILSGRILKRHVLVFIYLSRAAAISLFLLIPVSLASVYAFSAVMGFLWLATVPATSVLVAVMFGTRYMAMLYGIVFLGHQIGSFSGVWLGGWLYDRTGSYDVVWWLGVALGASLRSYIGRYMNARSHGLRLEIFDRSPASIRIPEKESMMNRFPMLDRLADLIGRRISDERGRRKMAQRRFHDELRGRLPGVSRLWTQGHPLRNTSFGPLRE